MPVYYKTLEKGQPGVAGGGTKKWYASTKTRGEVSFEELANRLTEFSTVSPADAYSVLKGLNQVLPQMLANGDIVRLGDIGNFYVSVSSTAEDQEEDVSASSIKKAKVLYHPGKAIANMLKTLTFKKA